MADFLELSSGETIDPHVVTNFKVNRNYASFFAASSRPDSKYIHTAAEGLTLTPRYVSWIIHEARQFVGAHITWVEAERLIPQSMIPVQPVVEEIVETAETENVVEAEKK